MPRDPAYRTLQKASNDLLETLKARLKGEDFQLVEQLLEQDLNVCVDMIGGKVLSDLEAPQMMQGSIV